MQALEYFHARLEATISPMDYMKSSKMNPETYTLIDVRNGPHELRNLIIEGAKVIPEQELNNHLHEIPKDKETIVYCWDVWCNTAAKAAKFLLEKGYKVKELTGGIAAWQIMNFPVTNVNPNSNLEKECGC